MRWKTGGDPQERAYGFKYDQANRLLKGNFTEYTGSVWDVSQGINFTVQLGTGSSGSSAYDENGNIKSMQQYGVTLNTSSLLDNLTYTYNSNSNKLSRVNDAITTDNKTGDFTDRNTGTSDDYGYDKNGNLITDLNKNINGATGLDKTTGGAIIYNYLNLPYNMTVQNDDGTAKGTITYIYDATGNKLEKKTNEPAQASNNNTAKQTYTSYLGSFVYQNNVLQFFGQEEGRIRPKRDGNGLLTDYVFDYFLKDHLGNVRMVLTDEHQQDIYPAATVENNAAALDIEKDYYDIQDGNIVDESTIPSFSTTAGTNYYNNNGNPPVNNNPSANTTAQSKKLYRLNGNTGVKTGLGVTLKVMSGDAVDIFGKSYYHLNTGQSASNAYPISSVLTNFINAFAATSPVAGKGVTGTTLNSSVVTTSGLTSWLDGVPSPSPDGAGVTAPKAYINWILFDEQFRPVNSGSGFDAVSASSDQLKTIRKQ